MLRGVRYVMTCAHVGARIALVLVIAFSLPKLGILYVHSRAHAAQVSGQGTFKLGIENVSPEFLRNLTPRKDMAYKVGLITNQSGKTQQGETTLDILTAQGVNVVKMFVPEHGIDGTIQGNMSTDIVPDKKTNIPTIALYNNGAPRVLDASLLKDIDVIMFDIQEMGMRHNTYLTVLFQALEAAALHNKTMVVFDRPNMLGSCMEGPLVDDTLKSAISYAAIPVRHGMTVGELAEYFNNQCMQKKAHLQVVSMTNYNRYNTLHTSCYSRLSPNINNIHACYGYSMLGLLAEVRPFDVALGTDKAFQCISLPDSIKFPQKKWFELHGMLKEQGVDAKFHRFYSTRKKQYCSGLLLRISDMNAVSSFRSLLMVLNFFKKSGVDLQFSQAFDKAVGTSKVREFLQGTIGKYELEMSVNSYLHDFFNKASVAFKYRPHPYLVRL